MPLFIRLASLLIALSSMAFYWFQDKFVFQKFRLERNYQFQFDQPFEEHFIPTAEGVEVNALLFRPPVSSKGLILYFHGNRDNLQRWGRYASDLTVHGYDVLMMDYRGYGKSGGEPDEQALYADAHHVLQWAKQHVEHKQLLIYGRSLGSSVASQLASIVTPDLLILETPFDELAGALSPLLKPLFMAFPLKYVFPTKEHLARVTSRKVIFHGTHDGIVPLSSALRLKPLLTERDEFVIIQNGRHANLREFEEYRMKLAQILGTNPTIP